MKQLNKKRSKDMERKLNNCRKELIKANKNISSIREILYYDIDKDLRLVNLTDEDNRQVDDILDEAIFDIAMATKAIEKKIRKL